MLKLAKLTIALAAASLAIPAMADWPKGPSADGFAYTGAEESGYQPSQYRYFQNEEKEAPAQWTPPAASARATAPAVANGPVGGFVYRGDGTGWEVAEHRFVFVGGRLAHSEECDHAIRAASVITPEIIESARRQWPGG